MLLMMKYYKHNVVFFIVCCYYLRFTKINLKSEQFNISDLQFEKTSKKAIKKARTNSGLQYYDNLFLDTALKYFVLVSLQCIVSVT